MSHLEIVKLLASGQTLQILEYISKAVCRSFSDIKKEFNLVNGEVTDYLEKLRCIGFVQRYENVHTHAFVGWCATEVAKKKLEMIFATIEVHERDTPI